MNQTIIGEKDTALILKGTSIKVQWGNKFIDIIRNGKIAVDDKNIFNVIESEDQIKKDGIYLLENDLIVSISGTNVKLNREGQTTYISYLTEQSLSTSEKDTALTNIGFYYNNLEDAKNAQITSGIIYVKEDQKLYLVNEHGLFEYKTNTIINNQDDPVIESLSVNNDSLIVDGVEYIKCYADVITLYKDVKLNGTLSYNNSSKDKGYRLYVENGKSYLEIDYLIQRQATQTYNYEPVKIFSKHNNIITSTEVLENNTIACTLLDTNMYQIYDFIGIIADYNITATWQDNIVVFKSNKELEEDILIEYTYDNEIRAIELPAHKTEISAKCSEDFTYSFVHRKELFQFTINEINDQTIIVNVPKDLHELFLNNCYYIYSTRYDFIKIENGLLSIDNTFIGSIEEQAYINKYKNTQSNSGIFSNKFVGLQPILYNSIFKSINGIYPKYDQISLPEDLTSETFDQVIPNIYWIKQLIKNNQSDNLPIGSIIMFTGNSNIPENWNICNGTNGTVDLTNKFIINESTEELTYSAVYIMKVK